LETESIVYGCIKHLPFGSLAERKASCVHNRRVLDQLPQADGWPFLCREMFAVPGADLMGGTYQTQVIHFGMSYQSVEYEWEHWLAKFESLLKQMYWVNAVVHLETEFAGHHTFIWDSADTYHAPSDRPLRVRCEWAKDSAIA
jgi:hypothetical protein